MVEETPVFNEHLILLIMEFCALCLLLSTVWFYAKLKVQEEFNTVILKQSQNTDRDPPPRGFDEVAFTRLLRRSGCFYQPESAYLVERKGNELHLTIQLRRYFTRASRATNELKSNEITFPMTISFTEEEIPLGKPNVEVTNQCSADKDPDFTSAFPDAKHTIGVADLENRMKLSGNGTKKTQSTSEQKDNDGFRPVTRYVKTRAVMITTGTQTNGHSMSNDGRKQLSVNTGISYQPQIQTMFPTHKPNNRTCHHSDEQCCLYLLGSMESPTLLSLRPPYQKGSIPEWVRRHENAMEEWKIQQSISLLVELYDWNTCPCIEMSKGEDSPQRNWIVCQTWEDHYIPFMPSVNVFTKQDESEKESPVLKVIRAKL